MILRTVTGRLMRANGVPHKQAPVVFKLMGNTYVGTETIPADSVTVKTDNNGYFTTPLWCNSEGVLPTKYLVGLSNRDTFYCVLEPGDPVDINVIRTNEIPDNMSIETVQAIISNILGEYVRYEDLPGGGDRTYRHVQNEASDTWTVVHNMNKFPAVTIRTSAGDEVEGAVHHVDNTTVIITFAAPFGGEVSCN